MTSGILTGHKSTREHPRKAGGTTEASEGQHLAAHQRIHGDDKAANGDTGWATQACKTPTRSWKNTNWAAQRTAQESKARNCCSGIGIKRPSQLWVIVLCTVCHFINKTQGFNTSYISFHDPLCIYLAVFTLLRFTGSELFSCGPISLSILIKSFRELVHTLCHNYRWYALVTKPCPEHVGTVFGHAMRSTKLISVAWTLYIPHITLIYHGRKHWWCSMIRLCPQVASSGILLKLAEVFDYHICYMYCPHHLPWVWSK